VVPAWGGQRALVAALGSSSGAAEVAAACVAALCGRRPELASKTVASVTSGDGREVEAHVDDQSDRVRRRTRYEAVSLEALCPCTRCS
jgi:hypothetical protein